MKQGRRAGFVGRCRERALWLLGAAVLIAVLWAIAQVLGWPLWARAVLAVLAAAAALIIPELRAWFVQAAAQAQLVKQRVRVSGGRGRLLRVRDVGLNELGVHAARVQVPYIKRDQQDKLEEAVGPGQAVLVEGHSMSGKTRLAAQVVKCKFPDALLLFAKSGKALRELLDGGQVPAGAVIWLNDLEQFLGADGVDKGLLDQLTNGRTIVVATIRIEVKKGYRPRAEQWPPEWDVIKVFGEPITLERRNTPHELDLIRATVNAPGVLAAIERYGLAEYLGGGPEALDKFKDGESENPVGHALVRAAIDWRRIGLTRPVSKDVLVRALPTYLADPLDVPRTTQAIDEGLAWATEKINKTVALLGQVVTDTNGPVFEAFDYLVDELTRTGPPVPDPMWELALEQAQSAELVIVGLAADRVGKQVTAETAWRRAIDSGQADVAVLLGWWLEKHGDLEGAKAAFQQAIDSGHADAAPSAAYNLGNLLKEQGDVEGAKAAYQRAIDSGHPDVAPRAVYNLGDLLEEQGDVEGAKAAYQRAIDSGHPGVVPAAESSLRALEFAQLVRMHQEEQGDLEEALREDKAFFQQAITSGQPHLASLAAVGLGLVLQAEGDLERAKALYQQAIASGDAEAAPRAAVNLGWLLEEQGDLEGAKAAYQQAIASGDAEVAPEAARNLEQLLRSTRPRTRPPAPP